MPAACGVVLMLPQFEADRGLASLGNAEGPRSPFLSLGTRASKSTLVALLVLALLDKLRWH